ncbi:MULTISPECIES: hypothetical protein [Streptomyces]|uniref:hypothetical protein n=1 Tax=Streptomyces TaxID=1883 RepID=UPI00069AD4FC|nr:hypothetical protein [Streptomyces sp. SID7805]MYU55850.1 hypothetical protein [Streptomyces sp. SID7805]
MRVLIAVPIVLLALAAAGCGSGDGDGVTAGAASSTTGTGTGGPDRAPSPGTSAASPAVPGQSVECGELPDALGAGRNAALFADPGAGGTVDCAEAHGVMTEFFLRAPRRTGGDRGSLAVRGWTCRYESGPAGTWLSSCRKEDREMHTEYPSDPDTGPGPSDGPDSSQLPSLPGDPSGPVGEPSTEEL